MLSSFNRQFSFDNKKLSDSIHTTRTIAGYGSEASFSSSIADEDISPLQVHAWDKKSFYSELVQSGLRELSGNDKKVIMLYESPSSSNSQCNFFNSDVYKFHDYPPCSKKYKSTLVPGRHSMVNGSAFPSFLANGGPQAGLEEHWERTVPGFQRSSYVSVIPDDAHVFAYFPCDSIEKHVNDPLVHYHLAGKDALPFITKKTTKLLPNTRDVRPCIAKTTHSMGSKGIFVIRNDEDEAEFEDFLAKSGQPTYVVTELIDIVRNVACHFFVHPDGQVTWFGSNENALLEDGTFSHDSSLVKSEQEHLQDIQLPYVKDVAQYCKSLGFWGMCGIDVLFDKSGEGYLVDLNPRVTGSCPAIMAFELLQDKYDFEYGLFRTSGKTTYYGPAEQLLSEVHAFNDANEGDCRIVVFSAHESSNGTTQTTRTNIGVYSKASMDQCKSVLDAFVQAAPSRKK